MAFGGGALLFALSVELFGHALCGAKGDEAQMREEVLVMAAAAVLGGLAFVWLDEQLSSRGGSLSREDSARGSPRSGDVRSK